MTPNRAKIVITNPCSENWNAMQVDAVGRFCQSCQKSVFDFTSKSDHEINTFLKNKPGEQLCGRFFVHQVERIRIEIDQNILISNIPFWQKFLAIILVCFGPDFLGADFIFAQTETDSIPLLTGQLDSLISEQVAETDSTLHLTVDLAITEPFEFKIDRGKWFCNPKVIATIGYVMGDISIIYEPQHVPQPEIHLPFPVHQPKKEKTGIANTSQNNSGVPKRPKKKPTPPENAFIADNDRRKTRRS